MFCVGSLTWMILVEWQVSNNPPSFQIFLWPWLVSYEIGGLWFPMSLKEGFERNPFSANIHQYGDVILSENIFEYLSGNFREQIGLQNPKSWKKHWKNTLKYLPP